jgi:hypothetical protein
MPVLNDLSPTALSAAMRGGTAGWGQIGSADAHIRYIEAMPARKRKKCRCGCERRATHLGMANGVCLVSGCEMRIRRWVKDPNSR